MRLGAALPHTSQCHCTAGEGVGSLGIWMCMGLEGPTLPTVCLSVPWPSMCVCDPHHRLARPGPFRRDPGLQPGRTASCSRARPHTASIRQRTCEASPRFGGASCPSFLGTSLPCIQARLPVRAAHLVPHPHQQVGAGHPAVGPQARQRRVPARRARVPAARGACGSGKEKQSGPRAVGA